MEINRGKLTVLLRQASLHATQKEEQLEPPRTQSHGCRPKVKNNANERPRVRLRLFPSPVLAMHSSNSLFSHLRDVTQSGDRVELSH